MRIYILVILLFCNYTLIAQDLPVVFEENFEEDALSWQEESRKSKQFEIKNGKYNLSRSTQGFDILTKDLFIDYQKDFEIEVTFIHKSGIGKYGIVWTGKRGKKSSIYQLFAVDATSFAVGIIQTKERKDLSYSTTKTLTKKENKLKIVAHDGKVSYYINKKKVEESVMPKINGLGIGIYVQDNITLEVDRIQIKQDKIIDLIPDYPEEMLKENIQAINTPYSEMGARPSADGKTLYFTRSGDPANTGSTKSDIYVANLDPSSNQWHNAHKIERPLNNVSHNYVIAVSPDENMLIVGNTYKADGSPEGGGLSMTYRTKDGWEIPEPLIITRQYNRSTYSEYALSPDSRVLLSCVERDDTKGSKDIYVSFLMKDDTWTEPKSIGGVVNTMGTEISPYLASDGKTLYYSTNGLPGYGSHDIFMTHRLDDTWLNWSAPKNLGPAINTKLWDAYYTVSADGKTAYMVSNTAEDQEDIISMKLPPAIQPDPIILVKGKVLDAKTHQPIKSKINYSVDINTKGLAFSSAKDGSYKLVLMAGNIYNVSVLANKYVSNNLRVAPKSNNTYQEIQQDIFLERIEEDTYKAPIVPDLHFAFDKFALDQPSTKYLRETLSELLKYPKTQIEISGHTDNTGPSYYNKILAKRRADHVSKFFIEHGIPKDRINILVFGEDKPKHDNTTYKGRVANRRVEVIIKKSNTETVN